MKINPTFGGFDVSAKGMKIQRKKMDLIAENIANQDTTSTNTGGVYKRKFLVIKDNDPIKINGLKTNMISLKTSNSDHIDNSVNFNGSGIQQENTVNINETTDNSEGNLVHMPEHPDADENGYVLMPNVNIINEMVDMIAATRSYEANVTAFNAAKQIAKDSLDI